MFVRPDLEKISKKKTSSDLGAVIFVWCDFFVHLSMVDWKMTRSLLGTSSLVTELVTLLCPCPSSRTRCGRVAMKKLYLFWWSSTQTFSIVSTQTFAVVMVSYSIIEVRKKMMKNKPTSSNPWSFLIGWQFGSIAQNCKTAKFFSNPTSSNFGPKPKKCLQIEALQKDITTRQEEKPIETSNTKQLTLFLVLQGFGWFDVSLSWLNEKRCVSFVCKAGPSDVFE